MRREWSWLRALTESKGKHINARNVRYVFSEIRYITPNGNTAAKATALTNERHVVQNLGDTRIVMIMCTDKRANENA